MGGTEPSGRESLSGDGGQRRQAPSCLGPTASATLPLARRVGGEGVRKLAGGERKESAGAGSGQALP